jgi:hypothetical protein
MQNAVGKPAAAVEQEVGRMVEGCRQRNSRRNSPASTKCRIEGPTGMRDWTNNLDVGQEVHSRIGASGVRIANAPGSKIRMALHYIL